MKQRRRIIHACEEHGWTAPIPLLSFDATMLPLLDLKIKRLDEARPRPRVIRPGILPP